MAISVGGFFANLSLKSDKESFDRSKKDLKELDAQTKKTGEDFESFTKGAIKGLLALGAAALGSAYAVSNIQAKMELTATKAGMGYNEFNKFSSALKLVGIDSSNVASKMAQVNSALNDFKVGKNSEALAGLAKNLALMGIDLKTFAGLSPTQQVELIAKKAESARGTDREVGMRNLADEIMGIGDTLMAIQQKGSQYSSFSALMAAGASAAWATNQSNVTKNAQAFNAVKNQMDQMWKEFGESMGTSLRPLLDDLANYIKEHKDDITAFFKDLGSLISDTITLLKPTLDSLVKTVGKQVHENAETAKMIEWQKSHPKEYLQIQENLQKTGLMSPILFGSKPLEGKANPEDALKAVIEMQSKGAEYSANVNAASKVAAGLSSTSTQVTVGNITLMGTDFNQFVNYMQANPGANKEAVAAAALVTVNNMAGTK